MNEIYVENMEVATSSEPLEVMDLEAAPVTTMEDQSVAYACAGTLGTLGTFSGCIGTLGTYGCAG
ncbi:hypothetical protein CIK91_06430 [Segatella bryantii]|uniref:Thiocillin family RiPP n=3 Tax=Segatella bryantii TaxID=77095 RepID=A0ABX4EHJ7_SEGBR|nr:hypothetical protein CIK91_06430 [Segatella bryantii]